MSMRKTKSKKFVAIFVMALFVFSFISFVPGTSDAADLQANGAGIEAGASRLEGEGAGLDGEGAELEGEGAGLSGEGAGLEDEDLGLDAMAGSSYGYPISDKNITPTLVKDNTPKNCDFKIDRGGKKVNGTWQTSFGKITITGNGKYFDWKFESSTHAVSKVYVKGGPNHHIYNYSGTGHTSDGSLVSPKNRGGNVPDISHLCFDFEKLPDTDPEPKKGSLKITKKVEGVGKHQDVPEFEITITGVSEGASYPDGNTKTFSPSRDNNDTKTWDNLIPGEYVITEGDLGPGWSASGLGTITVVADKKATATVTNTYEKPDLSKGALTVTKVVYGLPENSGFEVPDFEITITGKSDGASYPEGDTVTLSHPDALEHTWSNLKPGNYEISEADLGEDWIVDVPEGLITVTKGATVPATVTNTYCPEEPEKGNLTIKKEVDGVPEGSEVELDFTVVVRGPGESTSEYTLTFNENKGWTESLDLEPGLYTIEEEYPGSSWDVEYSSECEPVLLSTVGDNNGDGPFVVTVYDGQSSCATVTNTYRETQQDQKGDLEITKVVRRGNIRDRDRNWEFYVEIDGDPYVGEYTVGSDVRESDDGYLELKHGETAVISCIDVDTDYSVTETEHRDFRTSSTNAEGTIDDDGELVTFTNIKRGGGGGGGGGGSSDGDKEDPEDPKDPDEEEGIIVPGDPDPEAPPVIPDPSVPGPVIVPEDPDVKAPAMPKTGGYPLAMASLGTMLLGLGVYLRRK